MSEHRAVVDWSFWDSVSMFTIHEVAWLWCGLEPPEYRSEWAVTPQERDKMPPNPSPPSMGARIRDAILSEREDQSGAIKPAGSMSFWKTYNRSDLRDWAKRKGHQPLFLFPELRPNKESGLSLEGALRVIDALARLVHPKWDSDQRAYGLAPRIEQAGCNLERKQIGNYLKEARKIKKIG